MQICRKWKQKIQLMSIKDYSPQELKFLWRVGYILFDKAAWQIVQRLIGGLPSTREQAPKHVVHMIRTLC
ncbi:hypothetical protein FJSC11DRAFT_4281 [Fischerella thermalis JSC-11]|jgi:hypothetical protein|uniref:Uncharacterized protein n=2 Tax=Fischerella TaxID=1190 RepID=G6FZI2_9CYAN|nr:hypothetical protein FJSC11DRAFT_4281 [Fischerella thermalis JSC-11]PLZ95464.1 hypothetical protein CI592_22170 [Fischerella thermalis CCMEE 5328]